MNLYLWIIVYSHWEFKNGNNIISNSHEETSKTEDRLNTMKEKIDALHKNDVAMVHTSIGPW